MKSCKQLLDKSEECKVSLHGVKLLKPNLQVLNLSCAIQVDFTAKPQFWRKLQPAIKEKLGDLLVSLSYFPSNNTLTIGMLKVSQEISF